MEIGETIRFYRRSAGVTLRELGDAVFKGHSCVLAWEQGRTEPSIHSISLLCKFFDITPNDLLEWDKEEMSDRQMLNKIYSMIGRM